nr:carbamate kinase [Desulfovibrio sp. Huiquan2017]
MIVAALGGNALLRRGEPMTGKNQRANVRRAAGVLAELAKAGHALVITHGNGPQVGLLALQAAATPEAPFPLDVLDAESAGMIGYVLQQELGNALPGRLITTLLTQVRVDPADPAFGHPTKPIGPVYDEAEAKHLAAERGWTVAPDNDRWRRVVASPPPLEILETEVLAYLIRQGVIVICAGGGGIPVIPLPDGGLAGVEAVIDKDLASALLARQLGADMLLMLTDVEAVYRNFGTPQAEPIAEVSPDELSPSDYPAGSMGPKVHAAVEFAEATGKRAGIGRLEDAVRIVGGLAGTRIVPSRRDR